ncbi:MAG: hypothetical protein AB8H03_18520 [Saprospiraceae bacterium]
MKVKAKIDLFFFAIEKEFAFKTPLTFQNIKKAGKQLEELIEGKRSFKNL